MAAHPVLGGAEDLRHERAEVQHAIGRAAHDTHEMLHGYADESEDGLNEFPKETFVAKVKEYQADVVAMSALMTTTMNGMKDVISLLEKEGVRSKVKVIVGGAPVSQKWSDLIEADGYAKNGGQAVELVRDLLRPAVLMDTSLRET